MHVSFQHANVFQGNESTLLRFTAPDGRRACVLVDAGEGVDVDALLGADEYLNAICLTHAHIDHYRTAARNVTHGAPIYATAPTAAALERALPEAAKDNDVGPVPEALAALEPVSDWTRILPEVAVRPVPAGHAPGACGFVFRVTDEATDGPISDHYLLVTGDFTRRPCAGFPGLPATFPFEIDSLVMNVPTNDDYESTLQSALGTIFERAYGGSRVVLTAGSLAGVRVGCLLASLAAELERPLSVALVGQAAKLADVLGVEQSGLERVPVFDDPAAVVEPGGITIAGPEDPARGSARRLFEAIADDAGALFVQLCPDDPVSSGGIRCTTVTYDLANHPSRETVEAVVDDLAPKQVVIKHCRPPTLKAYQRDLEACFVWGSADDHVHPLYRDGEWVNPDWIGDGASRTIARKRRRKLAADPPRSADTVPAVEPDSIDLAAEGIDVEPLRDRFDGSIADPYDGGSSEPRDSVEIRYDEPVEPASTAHEGNRSSLSLDERAPVDALETPVLDGMNGFESGLEEIPARVIGDENRLLEPLVDVDLEPGSVVSIRIVREPDTTGT